MKVPNSTPLAEGEKRESIFSQLREGWFEFSSRKWIVYVVVGYSFFYLGFEGFLGVLAPVQIKEAMGGAKDMGIMMFGFGVGAILGTVFALKLRPRRPLLLGLGVLPVAALWAFALAVPLPLWVLFITALGTGIGMDLMYANWMTTLQTHVPDEALSRVSSYDAFGSMVFAPIGLFLAGPFTHLVGTRTALITVGIIIALATSLPLLSKEVRQIERIDV